MKHDFNIDLTIVIPVRIDSEERMRNLRYVLHYLERIVCKIIVLEADAEKKISENDFQNNCLDYYFVPDNKRCFHRTRYINQLLRMAKTKVVAVWDTDMIIPVKQIMEAYSNIAENCCLIAYPYNGDFVFMDSSMTNRFITRDDCDYYSCWKFEHIESNFCGGVFFADREKYITCGGENERFVGWGPEDVERLKRVTILEENVKWSTMGRAYHLFHPRKRNSTFYNRTKKCNAIAELISVCSMDKNELLNYIKTWK